MYLSGYPQKRIYLLLAIAGAFLVRPAWTAPCQDCEECVGCPYHVDGHCITNPVYWGYYEPNWRHWPGQPPRTLTTSAPTVPQEVSEGEIPKPVEEDEIIIRRKKRPPRKNRDAAPRTDAMELDRVPQPPLDLRDEDARVDPFQDDDEDPALLPEGIDDLEMELGDEFDDLNELLDDASWRPKGSDSPQNSRRLAQSRSGRPREAVQATKQGRRRNSPHRVEPVTAVPPRDSQVRQVSAIESLSTEKPSRGNVGNPLRRTPRRATRNAVADSRQLRRSNPLR